MAREYDPKMTLVQLQERLDGGAFRLGDATACLEFAWFPEHARADFQDRLLSDRGLLTHKDECAATMESEFWEEVNLLYELVPPGTAKQLRGWQKLSSAPDMHVGLNRAAKVFNLWGWVGMPCRYREGRVYRIWAPRDVVAGDPIVKSLPVEEFVAGVSTKTAADAIDLARLKKRLQTWQTVAAIGVVVSLAFVWATWIR